MTKRELLRLVADECSEAMRAADQLDDRRREIAQLTARVITIKTFKHRAVPMTPENEEAYAARKASSSLPASPAGEMRIDRILSLIETMPPREHTSVPCDDLRHLAAEIRRLRTSLQTYEAFARKVVIQSQEDYSFDGFDVHRWAVEAGVLKPHPVSEPCGESCLCAESGTFPVTCYRFDRVLREMGGA